jgi:fibronectin type 3 domain-containing protein
LDARSRILNRSPLPWTIVFFILGVLSLAGCAGKISAGPHSATLDWSPSTPDVVGYNIYRRTQSQAFYTLIGHVQAPATSFRDTTVSAAQTYAYVVTALDAEFNESVPSNEVFATIPA